MLRNILTGKGVMRAGRKYNNMEKKFQLCSFLSIYITNLALMTFFQELIYLEQNMKHINLNDKQSKGIHWVSLLIDTNKAVYFNSFGVEYIPQEV